MISSREHLFGCNRETTHEVLIVQKVKERENAERHTTPCWQTLARGKQSDGIRRCARGAACLVLILAAQARELVSLSGPPLERAEGAVKRHPQNIDDDDAAIELLSVSSVWGGRSVGSRAVCPIELVAKFGLATAMTYFEAPPPGYAVC